MNAKNEGSDEIVMSIGASPARRWFGVISLALLGVFLLSVVFQPVPGPWRAVLLLAGGGAFWASERLWRLTRVRIELTRNELRTSGGRIMTRLDNIRAVERGVLAFKPSNGFVVRLKKSAGQGWAPGLWWQWGRLLGVGGVVPGSEARAMADHIAVLVREQQQE